MDESNQRNVFVVRGIPYAWVLDCGFDEFCIPYIYRFKLDIPPSGSTFNGSDPEEGDSSILIGEHALKAGVLALPGTSFFAHGRTTAYVRASVSMLNDEDTDEAIRRLAVVVREARAAGNLS